SPFNWRAITSLSLLGLILSRSDMSPLISLLGGLDLNHDNSTTNPPEPRSPVLIVYIIVANGGRVTYLHHSRPEPFFEVGACVPDEFEPGMIYSLRRSSTGRPIFSDLSDQALDNYLVRSDDFIDARYESVVSKAQLTGCRVRDYGSCVATVVRRSPLILSMRATDQYLADVRYLCVDTGEVLDMHVDRVRRRGDIQLLTCTIINPRWSGSFKNSSLLYPLEGVENTSLVTTILQEVVRRDRPITNRKFLNAVYGEESSVSSRPVKRQLVTVSKEGGDVDLNPEMSEAVQRYADARCGFFVVEAPPGPAKSMILAAMAVNYSGPGLQLFLASSDAAVFAMADALHAIDDHTDYRILHVVSPAVEAQMKRQSPFAIFASFEEENPRVDVVLGTVARILQEMMQVIVAGARSHIQQQLLDRVRSIVVDEVNCLPESTKAALVHVFPNLEKIVFVGHRHDAKPVNYTEYDIASALAARPTLEVVTRKRNLPHIKIRLNYHEQPPRPRAQDTSADIFHRSILRHFSETAVVPRENRLNSGIVRSITKHCVAVDVNDFTSIWNGLPGNFNFTQEDLSALYFVLRCLRDHGCDHATVVAYDEESRKLAMMEHVPVAIMDSAKDEQQGMELTMLVSATTVALFSVAQRDHTSSDAEELIIVGREAICRTLPWQTVVTRGHFSAVSAPSPGPL
ncbi:hypothetical protein PENTCL1PPCAC_8750, partial [Pristionchus entomophagus]